MFIQYIIVYKYTIHAENKGFQRFASSVGLVVRCYIRSVILADGIRLQPCRRGARKFDKNEETFNSKAFRLGACCVSSKKTKKTKKTKIQPCRRGARKFDISIKTPLVVR